MDNSLRVYLQIKPYLTSEALELVNQLIAAGLDHDFAMQLVESSLPEDRYYEFG